MCLSQQFHLWRKLQQSLTGQSVLDFVATRECEEKKFPEQFKHLKFELNEKRKDIFVIPKGI